MDAISLLNYSVFSNELAQIQLTNKKQVVQTINAYSYVVAKSNNEFKKALQQADILLPDGFPVVWAARILKGVKIKKIAGNDLFIHLMHLLNEQSGKAFFLGSTDDTLAKIRNRCSDEFPNISVGAYSPPYKPLFTQEDSQLMIDKVNEFAPNVLFVGMTAPKQEMWVEQHKSQINAQIMCSIGAVFDFYAGTIQRAPMWMIKLHLEWFYRLLKEPKRLWRRYMVYSPRFFVDVIKEYFKRERK